MKIVQFGLPYSPNLGDGIISECLAFGVSDRLPEAQFVAIDLSGRKGFGDITIRNRNLAIRILKALPLLLRQHLVSFKLGKMLDAVEPEWRDRCKEADLIVIGGGQIFSDADLNFCLKIARAADIASAQETPTAIYAVGVSNNWTDWGKRLFHSVFSGSLMVVGLRDEPSLEAWEAQTGGRDPAPIITRDPGLLAALCFGTPASRDAAFGLCITAPEILSYHADRTVAGSDAAGFYPEIIHRLCARGERVRLFTNGAAEDRQALAQLVSSNAIRKLIDAGKVDVPKQPETPAELALLIASCASVIAHRLHACIVAYSYGIPVVGLGWDRKVESFFGSVGLEACFVGTTGIVGKEVADLAIEANRQGVEASQHQEALSETWAGLDAILGTLRG